MTRTMRGRGPLLALAATLLVALAPVAPAVAVGSGDLVVERVRPATAEQRAWERYGDSGTGWSGADSTYSVALPDGRTAWLFSDTFLGKVDQDHTRPADVPFIHNSIVVEHGGRRSTLHGGTPERPESLIGPTPPGPPTDPANVNPYWYWSGDGIVAGGKLRVFYLKFVTTGSGQWDFRWDSTAIATFSLPDLRLESLTPTYGQWGAGTHDVTWGAGLLRDGRDIYVYGVEDLGLVKYMHLARARGGDLMGSWEFWTGSGWSSDPDASARLMDGVSNEYSVTKVGDDQYVLITFDTNVLFGKEIVAYIADRPTGPFTRRQHVWDAPEVGGNIFAYNAHAHPVNGHSGKLLVSYNVNSFVVQDVYDDVRNYRPRFLEVRLGRG
jgi:hypothetical protein